MIKEVFDPKNDTFVLFFLCFFVGELTLNKRFTTTTTKGFKVMALLFWSSEALNWITWKHPSPHPSRVVISVKSEKLLLILSIIISKEVFVDVIVNSWPLIICFLAKYAMILCRFLIHDFTE